MNNDLLMYNDQIGTSRDREMPNASQSFGMVARSFKSSGQFCQRVFRMCKGGSSKKRTTYDNTIAEVSLASSGFRSF